MSCIRFDISGGFGEPRRAVVITLASGARGLVVTEARLTRKHLIELLARSSEVLANSVMAFVSVL